MATIRREVDIQARPADVWDAIRDFGAVHERVVPGFLVALEMDGDDRIVTFANGAVARERLVGLDDDAMRLAYTVIVDQFAQHSASVQIVPNADGSSRFVWITDVLPNEVTNYVGGMMEQGAQAAKRTLERQAVSAE